MSPAISAELLMRAGDALTSVPAAERADAQRVVFLCDLLASGERDADGALRAEEQDVELRKELGSLAEVLGRRSARAIPFAVLARAALADLSGDRAACQANVLEVDRHLSMRGL